MASLLEAVRREEESKECLKGLIFSLGLLAYGCDREGEVKDLLEVMDAKSLVRGKKELMLGEKSLLKEVLDVLG